MKTYVPKAADVTRAWWIVDASGLTLGRLATVVADRLRGKHKPQFVPYMDTGDHVIVVNAAKVRMTGAKHQDKMYRHHTGYPGGLKEVPAGKLLASKPERVLESAIKGMLPRGSLGRQMGRKLKVYAGDKHPHVAQQPKPLPIPGAVRA
ncbi:MAG TPA: 50S ribosomal protein L13 [Candidatus Polarisedimenticolaceae bacterium]